MSKNEYQDEMDRCMDNEELVAELMKHRQNEVKVLIGVVPVPVVGVSYEPVGDMIVIHLNPHWTAPAGEGE